MVLIPASLLQLIWSSCRRGYIIIWRPPTSCERHNSHSIQPFDSQGCLLISSTGCTCYLHRCISSFDSLIVVNMLHLLIEWTLYIYIYIYIYIFTNLLSTSIHGYQKKKPSGTRNKNISNHRPGEKRKKCHRTKRKKRPTLSYQSKTNQEMCSQLVKRKLKPVVNAAMPQLQEWSQLQN